MWYVVITISLFLTHRSVLSPNTSGRDGVPEDIEISLPFRGLQLFVETDGLHGNGPPFCFLRTPSVSSKSVKNFVVIPLFLHRYRSTAPLGGEEGVSSPTAPPTVTGPSRGEGKAAEVGRRDVKE